MKTISTILAFFIAIVLSANVAFGQTKTMTENQFQLHVQKIDSSLVGTWEKMWTPQQAAEMQFCQFNEDGTYISFKREDADNYVVTGKGKWETENGTINIIHGAEKGPGVSYESNGSMLIFGQGISYAKSALMYVEK
ncbi:MAG TPA: hypothetical protein PLA16_09165 [Chitinophagales bacterium]|jgi:hypothetical protein|nr:hypothetical protein [Chitinophagales bacterium]HQD11365.1 hypothetical protein [Chitinophagales bacterium]HQO88445.1 hypothetical protein [Chitinophagales bacterium]